MKKLTEFINGLPYPACVIDGSGRPAFLNAAMRKAALQPGSPPTAVPCFSHSPQNGGVCGDCPKYQVTRGHCAIPRVLPSARLVMATGLEKLDGATVAFYSNGSAPNPMEIYAAVGDILALMGASERRGNHHARTSTEAGWGAQAWLIDLLQSAVEGLESGKRIFEMKAGGEAYMDFTSLTAARLVMRRMALELMNLKPAGSVRVRSFTKTEKSPPSHVISMQARVGRQAVKSLSSDISAMDMRLSGYCKRLGRMMGLKIPPPHTLMGGENADLRFEFSGMFEPSSIHDHEGSAANMLALLSSRERQLVEMIAAGLTNDDISQKLGITVSTVKQHIKNIYKRTGTRNRLDLVLRAGV